MDKLGQYRLGSVQNGQAYQFLKSGIPSFGGLPNQKHLYGNMRLNPIPSYISVSAKLKWLPAST